MHIHPSGSKIITCSLQRLDETETCYSLMERDILMKDIWVMMYTVPIEDESGSQEIYMSHWMRLLSAFICNWNWQQLSWSNGSQPKKWLCPREKTRPERNAHVPVERQSLQTIRDTG